MTARYEYRVVHHGSYPDESYLNSQGDEGWELVQVLANAPADDPGQPFIVIFKRRIASAAVLPL